MDTGSLIQSFSDYLRFERHFSPRTARYYGTDLRQLSEYLDRELTTANADDLVSFIGFLLSQDYEKSSIARKVATIKSFYKFCLRRGLISVDPAKKLQAPKRDKLAPKTLGEGPIRRLLETPDAETLLGARDRAMLNLLYFAGIRVSELVGLNVTDIDYIGELLQIHGVGKKKRSIPVDQTALAWVRRYREMLERTGASVDREALFLNKHGQRLSTRSIRRKLDKYLAIAGMDPSVSPHTLRHSFASHLLGRGVKVRDVRDLLGVESLSSVQKYTGALEAAVG